MSCFPQEPTYYYGSNQKGYYQTLQVGPNYSPTSGSTELSMARDYSTQSNSSYSSGASASRFECPDSYPSPSQLQYSQVYPYSYESAQQHTSPAKYSIQPQKPSSAEAKPDKPTKAYPCLQEGCTSQAQFTRAADLFRHQMTQHFVAKKLDCPERWCGRVGDHGFTRKDHLVEHQRSFHMQNMPKASRGSKKLRHS